MKKFKSSPLLLHQTTDADLQRIVCPVCKENTVTLLTRKVVQIEGPVGHGTKGLFKGNMVSLVGVCPNAHHFVVRFGNHDGIGLMWTDVPGDDEQIANKEIVRQQALAELPPPPPPPVTPPHDPAGCGANTCPDCGGNIPTVNSPDLDENDVCPSGVSISGAISSLKGGSSSPICTNCPVLGCPGNPRNGTDAQHVDELVPGCPWSVEHYAVMTGWEMGKDLAICLKCPHVFCEVHPNHQIELNGPQIYADDHFAAPKEPSTKKGVYKGAVKIPVSEGPATAPVPAAANIPLAFTIVSDFKKFATPKLTADDLNKLRTRLASLVSDQISEGERKWATRLLAILAHAQASSSVELYESLKKMEKSRKEAGLPDMEVGSGPLLLPLPIPSTIPSTAQLSKMAQLASQTAEAVPPGKDVNGKVMNVKAYIRLLLNMVDNEASASEKAQAKSVDVPLASFLVRKMSSDSSLVSPRMTALLTRLATSQSLHNHHPECLVVTDIEATMGLMPTPTPIITESPNIAPIITESPNIAPKKPTPPPKKKKP